MLSKYSVNNCSHHIGWGDANKYGREDRLCWQVAEKQVCVLPRGTCAGSLVLTGLGCSWALGEDCYHLGVRKHKANVVRKLVWGRHCGSLLNETAHVCAVLELNLWPICCQGFVDNLLWEVSVLRTSKRAELRLSTCWFQVSHQCNSKRKECAWLQLALESNTQSSPVLAGIKQVTINHSNARGDACLEGYWISCFSN